MPSTEISEHVAPIAQQTAVVLRAFADYFSSDHSLERLLVVEQEFDRWEEGYLKLSEEIAPDGEWGAGFDSELYEPVFRNLVACLTLFQILGEVVSDRSGFRWGEHLDPRGATSLVNFEPIPPGLPETAVRNLLPDFSADVVEAFDAMTDSIPQYSSALKAQAVASLKSICQRCDCDVERAIRLADGWGFNVHPSEFAAEELGISVDEVNVMRIERQIVAVPLWTGGFGYPDFQFTRDGLRDEIAFVLEHASEKLCGWTSALWLARCVEEGRSRQWYEDKLSQRGLWKPNWSAEGTGEFDQISDERPNTDISAELFRITGREFGPFYFSSVHSVDPGHPDRVSPPMGRFDLHSRLSPKGAMYTAESASGACHEVLDRIPVLTLRDILDRSLWTLRPQSGVSVADLTGYSAALATATRRVDTQTVGLKMALRFDGIRVGLRTSSSENGVVLFGKAGAHLPGSAGLGVWSASRERLLRSEGLWDYIENRRADYPEFPILFRRFPRVA